MSFIFHTVTINSNTNFTVQKDSQTFYTSYDCIKDSMKKHWGIFHIIFGPQFMVHI